MKRFTTAMRATIATAVAVVALFPAVCRADASEIRLAKQYGLGYLPMMVMEHDHLIEKHAAALGLGKVEVQWLTLGGGSVSNDALLSGNVDIVGGGIGGFITLWERTRGNLDVKSPGVIAEYPMLLNTNNPKVHSIADFTAKDKIGLPAIRISPQALTLQAACAKLWGDAQFGKLDSITVNMKHPDAVQALLSGQSEVDAHFATPPFSNIELNDPKIHTVLNSFDVWGGPHTENILWATSKWVKANPKLYQAFIEALSEAMQSINADKRKAAQLYVEMTRDKEGVDGVYKIMSDPQLRYDETPRNILKFMAFKHRTHTLKTMPSSWKDLFFPNVWHLPGS
jgi:NitT/TauT family transport system substrate-binding protein